jgi:hypothetical protein
MSHAKAQRRKKTPGNAVALCGFAPLREKSSSRQQLLATMVLMGINRIVVTDGRISAKVTFKAVRAVRVPMAHIAKVACGDSVRSKARVAESSS